MRKNIINKEHNAKNFISPSFVKRTKKEALIDSKNIDNNNFDNK